MLQGVTDNHLQFRVRERSGGDCGKTLCASAKRSYFPPRMSHPTPHDPYAALRIPNFRWFVSSLLAMTVATQIQAVVVSWQIYELTRDPLSLGLIGLAEAVP